MSKLINFFLPKPDISETLIITDKAEACAAVLIACLRANELDTHAENLAFSTAISSRNVFKGADHEALIAKANQYYVAAGGPAATIKAAVKAIPNNLKMPLFYHCLDVILADGIVTPMEDKVFQYLIEKFEVPEMQAFEALAVLVEKNKL